MRNTLLLTRVLLKNSISVQEKKGSKVSGALIIISCVILWLVMLAAAAFQFGAMYFMGFTKMTLQMTFFSIFVLNIMQMLYMFPTTFYFSQDTATLLPLPLQPSQIVMAKTIVVLITLLPVTLMVGLGSMIGGAFSQALSVGGLIMMFFCILLLFLSETFIIAFLIMVAMRFMPFFRNKDLFNLICGLLALVFAIGISIVSMFAGQSSVTDENFLLMLTNNTGMMSMGSNIFFQTDWAVNAIQNGSILNFLLCVLSAIVPFIIFMWGAMKLYLPAVMASQASAGKKKKAVFDTRRRPIWRQFITNDLRLLVRTPAYLMNCVMSSFIGPVLIGAMLLFNPMLGDMIDTTRSWPIMTVPAIWAFPILIAIALNLFLGEANSIAATAVSREGRNGLNWMLSIPVSMKSQMRYKLVTAVIFTFVPSILYLFLFHHFLTYPIWMDLLFLATSLIVSIPINQAGIWVDLIHPKLYWSNETEAVKNNYNAMILVLLSMAVCVILVLAVVFTYPHVEILAIVLLILIACSIILMDHLITRAIEKHYR